jgi:hypothetical protein
MIRGCYIRTSAGLDCGEQARRRSTAVESGSSRQSVLRARWFASQACQGRGQNGSPRESTTAPASGRHARGDDQRVAFAGPADNEGWGLTGVYCARGAW